MKLYRPGDRSSAVCTLCGSVVTTTLTPPLVPLDDRGLDAKNVIGSACRSCGSVVDAPAKDAPAIAAAHTAAPQSGPLARKNAEAFQKRILSLIGTKSSEAGIRIVRDSVRVGSVRGGRESLIGYLSGKTLAQIASERSMTRTNVKSLISRAAYEISCENQHRNDQATRRSLSDESILARLPVRAVNSLNGAGMRSDEDVIAYLGKCEGSPFGGIKGMGRVTRLQILEAYHGLY